MNKIILIGNTVKDIEIKDYNGNLKGTFRLAVQKSKEQTLFVNCVCWNNTVNYISNYAPKGSKLVVEGRLDIYTSTKENGETFERCFVDVTNVEILIKSQNIEKAVEQEQIDTPKQAPKTPTQQPKQFAVDDEELPF